MEYTLPFSLSWRRDEEGALQPSPWGSLRRGQEEVKAHSPKSSESLALAGLVWDALPA